MLFRSHYLPLPSRPLHCPPIAPLPPPSPPIAPPLPPNSLGAAAPPPDPPEMRELEVSAESEAELRLGGGRHLGAPPGDPQDPPDPPPSLEPPAGAV